MPDTTRGRFTPEQKVIRTAAYLPLMLNETTFRIMVHFRVGARMAEACQQNL